MEMVVLVESPSARAARSEASCMAKKRSLGGQKKMEPPTARDPDHAVCTLVLFSPAQAQAWPKPRLGPSPGLAQAQAQARSGKLEIWDPKTSKK